MKIFAIYARLKITQKPDWLDNFRKKYDKPYHFHVTLKQPCFIEKNQVSEIKNKLSNFFSKQFLDNKKIELFFNKIVIDKKDGTIMINARPNKEIINLQKQIISNLKKYNNYYEIKTKEYEDNFEPHITIAQDLDKDRLQDAIKNLKDDYLCQGMIREIVLIVVDQTTIKETQNTKNITIYKL